MSVFVKAVSMAEENRKGCSKVKETWRRGQCTLSLSQETGCLGFGIAYGKADESFVAEHEPRCTCVREKTLSKGEDGEV